MEVAREDDLFILEITVIHYDLTITHKSPEIIQDNEKENSFTN